MSVAEQQRYSFKSMGANVRKSDRHSSKYLLMPHVIIHPGDVETENLTHAFDAGFNKYVFEERIMPGLLHLSRSWGLHLAVITLAALQPRFQCNYRYAQQGSVIRRTVGKLAARSLHLPSATVSHALYI